jgi:hypothetical protein
MKKSTQSILVILFTLISSAGISQVTDNDIVNSLLGRKHFEVNQILDSLGVWYHLHLPQKVGTIEVEEVKSNAKFYSISDSKGSVKVYILKLKKEMWIEEIVINFRHDSKEQVEDITKIVNPSNYHIGTYSTDITFRRKRT